MTSDKAIAAAGTLPGRPGAEAADDRPRRAPAPTSSRNALDDKRDRLARTARGRAIKRDQPSADNDACPADQRHRPEHLHDPRRLDTRSQGAEAPEDRRIKHQHVDAGDRDQQQLELECRKPIRTASSNDPCRLVNKGPTSSGLGLDPRPPRPSTRNERSTVFRIALRLNADSYLYAIVGRRWKVL